MFYENMKILSYTLATLGDLDDDTFGAFEYPPLRSPFSAATELLALSENNQCVAYARLSHHPTNDVLEFLEVAPSWRGRSIDGNKISRHMLSAAFQSSLENTGALLISRHTDKGRRSLLPVEEDVARQYPALELIYEQGV